VLDVAVEATNAGAMLVYWYGYGRVDQRGWLVDELTTRCAVMQWWCGDLMVAADDVDMITGELGVASSPGTGSGVVCVNVSAATVERCTALGTSLSAASRDRPIRQGVSPRLLGVHVLVATADRCDGATGHGQRR
jgi:hypothetical protein